ncbi:cold-shock protein [Glycomyces tenuis]|uniref:cold-shock protein n=1 Tax=Glycomyces tenuis TaxID=58116 RepID=UPI0004788C9A|nr:cold-shock protein [Glycomyces tenuis]
MPTGTVKWFDPDKGYGFIETDAEGGDLFVHFSQILDSGGFRTLEEGQRVRFEVTDSPKGKQASEVEPE